ncbi:TetR/AcrR family transcriptional regulator [Streptomyces sp. NPDC007095]|uniref:TetR/AcrR family transcriptional regulator n=1 Tax=Streptomyces sp. NPDC007095 TaxID=3154482 RepID=UPI0033EE70FF
MSDPTTPTPSPAAGAASTRDRVLDVAAQLYCQQVIHIGVDTSCRAAGVSTRSAYQLFGSDDQLMAAGLRERTAFGSEALLLPGDDDRPPRARILHVFERLEALERSDDFHGRPFIAATVQASPHEHPVGLVARWQQGRLTAFFQRDAERGGAADPTQPTKPLTFVYDGADAPPVEKVRRVDSLAVATAGTSLTTCSASIQRVNPDALDAGAVRPSRSPSPPG